MKNKLSSYLLYIIPFGLFLFFIYMAFFYAHAEMPGKELYMVHCAGCHGEKGEGVMQLIPPLYQANIAKQNIDSIPKWIKHGLNGKMIVNGKTFDQPMYPIALTEVQLANLMNYLCQNMLDTSVSINEKWIKDRL